MYINIFKQDNKANDADLQSHKNVVKGTVYLISSDAHLLSDVTTVI